MCPVVSFHLTVAGSLEPLADAVAELLGAAHPATDPFRADLVVVPSAGVRSWLGTALAARLGATERGGDGIVADIDWRFPNSVLALALGGGDGVREGVTGTGEWRTGALTWSVYDELVADGARYGQSPDAVRARAIADLFDRYTLHRQAMVLGWGRGSDDLGGGRAVPEHQRWQPELWRAVRARTGGSTDAEVLHERLRSLRTDGVGADVPDRIVVFGLASLPPPHLAVLGALAGSRDIHVFAPTPSAERWTRLVDRLPNDLELPVPRDDARFPVLRGNPLVSDWGRTSLEAHGLLHLTAVGAGATVERRFADVLAPTADTTLLGRVQHDLVTDTVPAGLRRDGQPIELPILAADDRSVQWHRCHGSSRQVEVLRDAILHLLAERDADGAPRFRPRDIAVLTPDIARYAPLVDAVFAGDELHGVPAIPLEVADRSLRQDNRLVDALLQLFDLTEGRFRATDLLRFLSAPVVRRRFALDTAALERITTWVESANVRWGIDGADLERFGVPGHFDVFTWRAAIDRLLLGATLADGPARLGPGGIAPMSGIEGTDLVIAGRLAEAVRTLAAAVERLTRPGPVHDWCEAVARSIAELFALSDDDAGASRPVDFALSDLADDALVDGAPDTRQVDPRQLAELLRQRLETGSSRPRFGTGAVTLSSLTAQRGVPYRVICVLGLDVEAVAVASADDLVAARPCVGDRDARAEQRAQLLDAVLAAGERFVVLSNGRDIRSNTELPPVATLAEFLDVLDATARGADGETARKAIVVDHPRQAWSERSFEAGTLGVDGPWGFDRGALDAVRARAAQLDRPSFLDAPLDPPATEVTDRVTVSTLLRACTTPVRTFLQDRLGVFIPDERDDGSVDDAIPFSLGPLEQSAIDRSLLAARLGNFDDWTSTDLERWTDVARRRGDVPPAALGDPALSLATTRVDAVLRVARARLDEWAPRPVPVRAEVEVDGVVTVIEGTIEGLCGDVLVDLRVARPKPGDVLEAWIRLALLAVADPSRPWRALLVTRAPEGDDFQVVEVTLRDPGVAERVLQFAVDMWRRALCDAIPFFSRTSRAVVDGSGAAAAWSAYGGRGERSDRWNALAFDVDFAALSALPARAHEDPGTPRLAWWARRVWSAFDATAERSDSVVVDASGAPAVKKKASRSPSAKATTRSSSTRTKGGGR